MSRNLSSEPFFLLEHLESMYSILTYFTLTFENFNDRVIMRNYISFHFGHNETHSSDSNFIFSCDLRDTLRY